MNISFAKFGPFQLICLLALILGLNSWGRKGRRTNNQYSEVRVCVMNNLPTRNNASHTNTSTVRSVVASCKCRYVALSATCMVLHWYVSYAHSYNVPKYRTCTITKSVYHTSVPYFLAKLEAYRTVFR